MRRPSTRLTLAVIDAAGAGSKFDHAHLAGNRTLERSAHSAIVTGYRVIASLMPRGAGADVTVSDNSGDFKEDDMTAGGHTHNVLNVCIERLRT